MKNANTTFIAVDVETTGFSATADKLTEIGAVKVINSQISEEFNQLINPGSPIPRRITEITGITIKMVEKMPAIDEVMPKFLDFCHGYKIVAHNAKFDMSFIKTNARRLGLVCKFDVIDTLELCRRLFPRLKNHRLDTVASYLAIDLKNHHRAINDARAVAHIFIQCTEHKINHQRRAL